MLNRIITKYRYTYTEDRYLDYFLRIGLRSSFHVCLLNTHNASTKQVGLVALVEMKSHFIFVFQTLCLFPELIAIVAIID